MARKSRKAQIAAELNKQTIEPTPVAETVYQVGLYARKSVDEEKKGNGNESIITQISMLERYVAMHADLKLVDRYIDNGYTGTNFDRPEFNRLMEDVRIGRINCVIVKDLSRFGRNYLEAGKLLEVVFPYLNVRFIAMNDGYDSITGNTEEQQFNASISNLVNDSYARDISKAINAVYAENFERGNYMGPFAPYGYVRSESDPHKLEIDNEVADVVRNIFQMRADGASYQGIADYLNKNGIESPSNYKYRKGILKDKRYAKPCLWGDKYIRQMLSNPVYIGAIAQGRQLCRNDTNRKAVFLPREQWKVKEHMHPALVSSEIWNAVQERKKTDEEVYRSNFGKYAKRLGTENILKGKLICALCGKPLRRGNQFYKDRLIYSYYCVTRNKDGEKCANRYQNEEKLFNVIMKAVKQQICLAVDAKKMLAELSQYPEYNLKEAEMQATLKEVEHNRKLLLVKKTNLYSDFCDGIVTKEDYLSLSQTFDEKIQAADRRVEQLTVELYKQQTMGTVENRWITEFDRFRRKKKLSKDIVDTLIDKIYVHGPYELEIVFNYRDEYNYLMEELDKLHVGGVSA